MKPKFVWLLALVISAGCGENIEASAAQPLFEQVNIFEAETGGYAHYRVPAIAVSPKGTVLAFVEARKSCLRRLGHAEHHDAAQHRRRPKHGRSRESSQACEGEIQQNAVAFAQDLAKPGEVTYNNIVPIVDHKNGVLHFLFCVEYARAYYMRSDDDAMTFSEPVDITSTFEKFSSEYDWKVLATGPGHGIQLENGRLVVPVWLSDGTGGHAHRPSIVSVIYSDDSGASVGTRRRGGAASRVSRTPARH